VNVQDVATECNRVNTRFALIDALRWQEIVQIPDDDLREFLQLSPGVADAMSAEQWDAMEARDNERVKRKYCGRDPDELEEERDFDPSGEPKVFQRIWATDLTALTYEQLCHLREHKWPDDIDLDDVSDEGRRLWHRRVWAMTREEFEEAYAASKNARNIAHNLLSDIYDIAEQSLTRKHSIQLRSVGEGARDAVVSWQRKELQALLDAHNARIDAVHKLTDSDAVAIIADLRIELAAAKAAGAAERAERVAARKAKPLLAPNVEIAPAKRAIKNSVTFEQLTHCPGLVGEIVDWVCSVSRRPNRTLALGAAITTIGTLAGRYFVGPTDSGTHLYVAMLVPTGGGKDDPLNSVTELLCAAGCEHLIGQEFMSETAVSNWLCRQPLSLCPIDEFGMFLGKINSRGANAHEKNVIKMLNTAWGRSFKLMKSAEKAGVKSEAIWWPALSMFAASTPDTFFESLTGADLSNGFLNRLLVLPEQPRAPKTKPKPCVVPTHLATNLGLLHREPLAGKFPIKNDPVTGEDYEDRRRPAYQTQKIEWANNAVEALYNDYDDECLELIDKNKTNRHFIARNAETAVRLATIRALATGFHGARVKIEDMQWGIDVVRISSTELVAKATNCMIGEQLSHGKLHQKLTAYIGDAGKAGIGARALHRHVQAQAKSKEVQAVLHQLVESETIIAFPPPAGGPNLYRLP